MKSKEPWTMLQGDFDTPSAVVIIPGNQILKQFFPSAWVRGRDKGEGRSNSAELRWRGRTLGRAHHGPERGPEANHSCGILPSISIAVGTMKKKVWPGAFPARSKPQ